MIDQYVQHRAELYFRTYLHTVIPLHLSLIGGMCKSPNPPLELATVLEDIGHHYIEMASDLNGELIRRGLLDEEPEPEDQAEARIEEFVGKLLAKAGQIQFIDGQHIDGKEALAAFPAVADAIKAALHVAHAHMALAKAPVNAT